MGFVIKLLNLFIPIIAIMIFYYQRDHILDKKQNDYLDEQFSKFALQFNHHLDNLKGSFEKFLIEKNKIVDETVNKGNDEADSKKTVFHKEKEVKKSAEIKSASDKLINQKESFKPTQQPLPSASIKNNQKKCDLGKDLLFTKEQLAKHNGEDPKKKIYLAFLGIVYDVSKGETHYAPGGSYSMFTGKDASRAFITGDFSESGLIDDLSDLKSSDFSGVKEWTDFYDKTYKRIGRLVGAFYNQNGCQTDQIRFVERQLEEAKKDNLDEQYENELFPPCNLEYNENKKETRFWCTKKSGGINRDWTGVPRQFFSLKNKKDYRCACIRDFGPETNNAIEYADEEDSNGKNSEIKKNKPQNVGDLNNPRVREFKGCNQKSLECVVKQ